MSFPPAVPSANSLIPCDVPGAGRGDWRICASGHGAGAGVRGRNAGDCIGWRSCDGHEVGAARGSVLRAIGYSANACPRWSSVTVCPLAGQKCRSHECHKHASPGLPPSTLLLSPGRGAAGSRCQGKGCMRPCAGQDSLWVTMSSAKAMLRALSVAARSAMKVESPTAVREARDGIIPSRWQDERRTGSTCAPELSARGPYA